MKNKILIGLVVFLIVGVIGFNVNLNIKDSSKTSGLRFAKLQLLAFGEGGWDGEWGSEEPGEAGKNCVQKFKQTDENVFVCIDENDTIAILNTYIYYCEKGKGDYCFSATEISGNNCEGKISTLQDLTIWCY